jgi:hypothetical protein
MGRILEQNKIEQRKVTQSEVKQIMKRMEKVEANYEKK